ncbi:MAG: SufD family Fe-S cluster assembly protein, partial [Zestosphaera sp.]
ARSRIEGRVGPSRGHIECLGLIDNDNATIESLPEISSSSPEAILTHEAAIGKISEDLINYLLSKGFSEEEARTAIIKGFLNIEEPKLPQQIREVIKRTIEYIASRATG